MESPGYFGATPRFTHNPYTPQEPLLKVHSQLACPAYYLREPRYGLPHPPHRPHRCRKCCSPINRTWSSLTYGAMWRAWTTALKTVRPPGWPRSWRTRPLDPTPSRIRSEGPLRRPK